MRRLTWIGLAVIGVLIVAVLGWMMLTGKPITEVGELIAQGGEKRLRDPMRPARGTTRVLLIALDGVGEDELLHAIREGSAPNIASVLGAESIDSGVFRHAYAVPGVLTILPSTTVASWTALFTGEPAARNGVPGNEWFVREEMRFHAPAPVSVTDHEDAVRTYTDDLVGRAIRVPTIYEMAGVRSYVSLSHVHRGADLLTTPDPDALGELIEAVATGLTDDGEGLEEEAFAALDRSSIESLVGSLEEHGIPDLQTIYFPGIDLYTHVSENPLSDQRRYLRQVIDSSVGVVLDAYRAASAIDGTYIIFVSDHGHTPVLGDDLHALGAEGDDEPSAVIANAGFRMREMDLDLDDDEQDFQATVAYQGAFAYVYLADRSTCVNAGDRCEWKRAPRWEEDVLPVIRAFDSATRSGAGVPELRGAIDLIFSRLPRPPGQDALPFQVWDGGKLVPVGTWLASNPRPDLVELESRLEGLGAGPYGHRAGDVLLLARSGTDVPIEQRFYFSGRYRSWHGSPSAQDSRIPLLVARAGSTGAGLREEIRGIIGENPTQLSIARLVTGLLARSTP